MELSLRKLAMIASAVVARQMLLERASHLDLLHRDKLCASKSPQSQSQLARAFG